MTPPFPSGLSNLKFPLSTHISFPHFSLYCYLLVLSSLLHPLLILILYLPCPHIYFFLSSTLSAITPPLTCFPPRHPHPLSHHCLLLPPPLSDIRLRVRAEYLEHESALRGGVSSDKQQPLERQFELFSQANSLLRARDLGSIVCDIKFTELDNLEAFWGDYLSGALLEALKGVFITDSLRMAAGSEGVRLLISVDQDDYEEGRRLLGVK